MWTRALTAATDGLVVLCLFAFQAFVATGGLEAQLSALV